MTNADRRATLGTVLALTGGALLIHDLWTHHKAPRGGSNPWQHTHRQPRVSVAPRWITARYVGGSL